MAGFTRRIHPSTNFLYGKAEDLIPDATVTATHPQNGNEVEMFALVMQDPDGECHVYPMDENGKRNLMATLTGGVVLP